MGKNVVFERYGLNSGGYVRCSHDAGAAAAERRKGGLQELLSSGQAVIILVGQQCRPWRMLLSHQDKARSIIANIEYTVATSQLSLLTG